VRALRPQVHGIDSGVATDDQLVQRGGGGAAEPAVAVAAIAADGKVPL
jgi:hypothetical protein